MHHCHKLYTQEPEYITIYITLIIHAGEKHHGIHHTNNRLMITSTVLLDKVYKLSDTTIGWGNLDCVLVFPGYSAMPCTAAVKGFNAYKGNSDRSLTLVFMLVFAFISKNLLSYNPLRTAAALSLRSPVQFITANTRVSKISSLADKVREREMVQGNWNALLDRIPSPLCLTGEHNTHREQEKNGQRLAQIFTQRNRVALEGIFRRGTTD